MSLIIAYLGVSKVTVALERYMNAKQTIGCAVLSLRELNQLAMTLTETDKSDQARAWRKQVSSKNYIAHLYYHILYVIVQLF